MKNNKGFSLVELIIVIAIMVVLIGLLAPQFVKYVEKSKESTDVQNLDSIVTVCQAYMADQPSAEITIDGSSGVFVITGMPYTFAASDDGKSVTGVKIKGDWSTTALKAVVATDGKITYTGEAKYIKVTDNAFVGK